MKSNSLPEDAAPADVATPASEPVQTDSSSSLSTAHFVVGIGASAGGLEAIERFFDNVPEDCGLTFVIVQHLSPDFKSLMDELLARHTKLPIHRVENGLEIQPNAIYLIPRKKNMVLSSGRLMLTDHDQKSGLNLPIDLFFQSLAQDMGDRAIAVILSGTGSDGSRGIKELHEAGGLVVVQDPESAAFDGMPKAALATGLADVVLAPTAMPAKILQYSRHPVRSEFHKVRFDIQAGDELSAVFSMLRRHFGVDFSLYKPGTLARRMERRMTLQNIHSLADYLTHIEANEEELNALYRDLLVEVTQFFRDKKAFELIKTEVIPKLVEQASEDGIRVWVPGCATGEEAYTLAMLFHEYAETNKRALDLKIFATDVHRNSLDIAGAGAYRESSVADLPKHYLDRYFVHKRNQYVVGQDLRKLVIFAPHNLTKDPPFTKLDLITCRNVLIYINPATQRKILSLFHFGLRVGGVLFLGPSETLTEAEEEFDVIDRHWKIFRKRRDVRLSAGTGLASMPLSDTALNIRHQMPGQIKTETSFPEAYEGLLARYVPPSLLLNERHELVHSFGDARKYLHVPEGKATNDVLKMVDDSLRIAISSALHQSGKSKEPLVYTGVRVTGGGRESLLKISVVPLPTKRSQSHYYLVCLEEEAKPVEAAQPLKLFDVHGQSAERITVLERELMYTKEHLQSTIEELETSNEELQSTNEELVASNEELQSTNEELHSVNEELYTVNAEHQRKIDELTQLTSDMDNLLASTEIGTIFLDLDQTIRKFTPAIGRLFNLLPHDVGRPLKHISNNLSIDNDTLAELMERVRTESAAVEQEVAGPNRQSLLLRVLPYHAQNGEVAGTVLTFVDISAVKQAKKELGASEQRFEAVLDHSTAIIFVKDLSGRYTLVNRRFSILVNDAPVTILGASDHDLFDRKQAEVCRENDQRVLATGNAVESEEVFNLADGPHTFLSVRFPLRDSRNQTYAIAGIVTDITDRKRAENDARDALERRDQFLAMLSHELRNPLAAIMNATQVLRSARADAKLQSEANAVIQRQVDQMARLLDDLLDVTRIAQNRIRLQKTPLDLRAIVAEAVRAVQSVYANANVELSVSTPSELIPVSGDAARLQQMVVNLLTNAAKYTPAAGKVWLTLSAQAGEIVLTVKDTGVGIRPEMLEKVFEMFVQANETLDRSDGGVGVGLTLVRTIAELHGGSARATSDGPGRGTEFVIRLPRGRESPTVETPAPLAPIIPTKVLIVEDNPDSRGMLQTILKLDGYEVFVAEDGERGLAEIFRLRPRFAVVDIGLPGLDGYQVAKRVREKFGPEVIWLIALTGYGRPKDREAVREAGFDEHLVKPLKPEDLARVMRNKMAAPGQKASVEA